MEIGSYTIFLEYKKKYNENEVLLHLNIIALVISVFFVLILLFYSNYLHSLLFDNSGDKIVYIYSIICIIPFQFFYLNYAYIFLSREDIYTYNLMTIIKTIIGSLGAIFLLLIFDLGLWSVIVSNIFGVFIGLITGIIVLYKDNPNYKFTFKININLIKDFFNYSYNLYLSGLISHLNIYFIKTFLSVSLSSSKVAFFGMAQDRVTLLDKFPAALNTVLFPRISSSTHLESVNNVLFSFRILCIILIFISVLLLFFIEPIILILYGKEFFPVVSVIFLLIPGILFNACTSVFTNYFMGSGKVKIVMKLSFIPLIIQIILGLIMIDKITIHIAAIIFSFSLVIFSIFQIYFFIKLTKSRINTLLFTKNDFYYLYNFLKSKVLIKN